MWEQLSEAGAGVSAWLPLHLLWEDVRVSPALSGLAAAHSCHLAKQHPHAWCWRGERVPVQGPCWLCTPNATAPWSWPCCCHSQVHTVIGKTLTVHVLGMQIPPQHSLAFSFGKGRWECTGEGRDSHHQHRGSSVCGSPCPAPPSPAPYLGLNVQNGNFILLVDLVNCFKLGSKHVSLVASKLQELIGQDVPSHLLSGDKVVVLPIHLVLLLGACGVCGGKETVSSAPQNWGVGQAAFLLPSPSEPGARSRRTCVPQGQDVLIPFQLLPA